MLRWTEPVVPDPSVEAAAKARSDGVQDLPEQNYRRLIIEILNSRVIGTERSMHEYYNT